MWVDLVALLNTDPEVGQAVAQLKAAAAVYNPASIRYSGAIPYSYIHRHYTKLQIYTKMLYYRLKTTKLYRHQSVLKGVHVKVQQLRP